MNIQPYVRELLFEHDCVIIPGFGGFVGRYAPASVHPVTHTFYPPSKAILFNVNLKNNDGLLANHIAVRENCTFTEANRKIRDFVEGCQEDLRSGYRVNLEEIGVLSRNPEGNIAFEPDTQVNFLTGSFGLVTFVSQPVKRAGFQERMEKKITRYHETRRPRRVMPAPLRWAAILALPVGIAAYFAIQNFDKLRYVSMDYTGMLTFNKPAEVVKIPLPVPVKKTYVPVARPAAPETKAETPPPVQARPEGHVAIIVGAFQFRENADRLVEKLKEQGYPARIIDQTSRGLYRVTIQTFDQADQALAALGKVRNDGYQGAWILTK